MREGVLLLVNKAQKKPKWARQISQHHCLGTLDPLALLRDIADTNRCHLSLFPVFPSPPKWRLGRLSTWRRMCVCLRYQIPLFISSRHLFIAGENIFLLRAIVLFLVRGLLSTGYVLYNNCRFCFHGSQ